MKTVVKILKGIGFGLFKIHLWLPALYSVLFLIIAISTGATNPWAWYLFGLVLTLIGSMGLVFLSSYLKKRSGKYEPDAPKKKKEKRERLFTDEEILARKGVSAQVKDYQPAAQPAPSQYDYAPQPEMQYAPQPAPAPQVNYSQLIYGNQQQQQARPMQDYNQALYGNQPQSYSQPPAAQNYNQMLYGQQMPTGRQSMPQEQYGQMLYGNASPERDRSGERPSLYDNSFATAERQPAIDPQTQLYGSAAPAQPYDRTLPPSQAQQLKNLYPEGYGETVRPDRQAAGDVLYDQQFASRETMDRRDASGALYPDQPKPEFNRFEGFARNPADLYANQASANGEKSFTSYVQPVNSVLPNRAGVTSNVDALAQAGFPITDTKRASQLEDAERLRIEDANFMRSANLDPLSSGQRSRRREVPVQIFATRSDPNVYVYEYADRYEYIRLHEDGNKELVKSEPKEN